MAGRALDQCADFVHTTLNALPDNEFESLITRQSYVLEDLMDKGAVEKGTPGKAIQFEALVKAGSAQAYYPGEALDMTDIDGSMVAGEVPYKFYATKIIIDEQMMEQQEAVDSNGAVRQPGFIKLRDVKREQAVTGLANLLDDHFHSVDGNIGNAKYFYGLKYWLTGDGLAADGTASVAGISTTTTPRWKNQAIYISTANKLRWSMIRMARLTRFRPVPHGMRGESPEAEWKKQIIVCDGDTGETLEEILYRQRGDNVSSDLSVGMPVFRGRSIMTDESLGNGVKIAGTTSYAGKGEMYFLNKRTFKVRVDPKHNFEVMPPREPVNQFIKVIWIRWKGNTVCINREANGVIYGWPALVA